MRVLFRRVYAALGAMLIAAGAAVLLGVPWGWAAAGLALVGFGVAMATLRPLEQQLESLAGAADRIAEGELSARAKQQSDDQAGRLAGSFNTMAARVQTMVETRRSLLHGVSHELRTPLARLKFAMELLDAAHDEQTRRRRIDEMLDDVAELESLVAELLTYSELEGAAPLQLEEVDLGPVVEGLTEEASRLRPEKDVSFEERPVPALQLDPRMVQRSIGNLINNAARYSESYVRVTLARAEDCVVVRVEDDGPGVPEADRERIFQPFLRLDEARSRDAGGIGLGLALSGRAVRAHDGDLVVQDSELGGACFHWSVPLPPERRRSTLERLTGTLLSGEWRAPKPVKAVRTGEVLTVEPADEA